MKIVVLADDGELYGEVELAGFDLSKSAHRGELANEIVSVMPAKQREEVGVYAAAVDHDVLEAMAKLEQDVERDHHRHVKEVEQEIAGAVDEASGMVTSDADPGL